MTNEEKRAAIVRAIRADEMYLLSLQRDPEVSDAYERELERVEDRLRRFRLALTAVPAE